MPEDIYADNKSVGKSVRSGLGVNFILPRLRIVLRGTRGGLGSDPCDTVNVIRSVRVMI